MSASQPNEDEYLLHVVSLFSAGFSGEQAVLAANETYELSDLMFHL